MRTAKPSPIAMYIAGENESVIADALINQSRRDALARAHQRVLQDMRAERLSQEHAREQMARFRKRVLDCVSVGASLGVALYVLWLLVG